MPELNRRLRLLAPLLMLLVVLAVALVLASSSLLLDRVLEPRELHLPTTQTTLLP